MNPHAPLPFVTNRIKIMAQKIDLKHLSKSHFQIIRELGASQYGDVWLAKKYPKMRQVVLKQMNKMELYKRRVLEAILNERTLLSQLMHPFFVNIQYAF